jgi:hypothetical protein
MLDKFSIRVSLILVAGCNIVGSALKLLVNKDKSLASSYIGQIIACLFQPVLLNSPGKIAANWFREDIRTVICTICCLAVTSGALVGFLWNLMFVDENAEKDKYKDQVFNYFLSEFILNVVFCVPTFFITKDKPEIPPSPSQENFEEKIPGLVESLKLLFTNFRFICLFIAYLLVIGYFDIMSTIINSLLDLYNITGNQSSVIYAVASVVGMISSLVISWILDKYQKSLGKLVQYTKIDTKNYGKSLIQTRRYLKIYKNLVHPDKRDKSIFDMDSIDRLINNTWIEYKTENAIMLPF